jgi:hypothetical protein
VGSSQHATRDVLANDSLVDVPANIASHARMRKILVAASCVLSCVVALSFNAPPADAFCGFYVGGADAKLFNNATQVVLMREGTRTVLSMQNNYEGPPSNFAMVVPVPVVLQKENVRTLPKDIFAKVDALSAPRLVEYWEQDPCKPDADYERSAMASAPGGMAIPSAQSASAGLGVKIEAQFTVGEYQIVILSAKDSNGLETWLKQEKYVIPEGAATFFKPYVQSGSKFFVARVDSSKVTFEKGQAMLSPLRFYYDSESFSLPVRLGLMNAKGPQDLIVNILAKNQRYEVANYPNVTIPTNYDVKDNAKSEFPTFYAALFDETVKKTPRAVVTEYAWDASSCDPCPGPALSPNDFYTLGADVLPSAGPPKVIPAPGAPGRPGSGIPGVTGGKPTGPAPNGAPSGAPFVQMPFVGGFTITRLHARYTKESLGEDLVFKAAPAISGGREVRAKDNALEHGAQAAQYGGNNFQGRYAVRHPWEGAIACDKPVRGRWGGPPGRDMWSQPPVPAKDTAFAPRGQTPLASYLVAAVTELDIKPSSPPPPLPTTPATVSPAPSGTSAPMPPKEPPASGGCGSCAQSQSGGAPGALGLLAALALVLGLRRKR